MGVLHGGIQATLMDEMAAWVVFIKLQTAGVTSGMQVKYTKPVYISKGQITVRGSLVAVEKRMAKIDCILFDGEGKNCANARVEYYVFPEKIARKKYMYPGIEAFLPSI